VRRSRQYTGAHARAGLDAELPEIETFENQFPGYEIEFITDEFQSVCPKTGLPDQGTLILRYVPYKSCLELKSLKMYLVAYRNIGIFQENVVNRYLRDVVEACDPVRAEVVGEFAARGGISSRITARHERPRRKR